MKTIHIQSLALYYFKGIRELHIDLLGDSATISGANATGKSTIVDAWQWLLFGKNAAGQTQFEIKTIGEEKMPHTVIAELNVDGEEIKLERTYKEKWVRKRGEMTDSFDGHETALFYNNVPCSAKEYAAKISEICPEASFRYISNPLHFCSQHPNVQREMLFSIAGEVTDAQVAGDNESLQELLTKLQGKSLDELKKEVQAKIRGLKQEKDSIPARIQEIGMMMPEAQDWTALEERKAACEKRLEKIDNDLAKVGNTKAVASDELTDLYRAKEKLAQEISDYSYNFTQDVAKKQQAQQKELMDYEKSLAEVDRDIAAHEVAIKHKEDEANRLEEKRKHCESVYMELLAQKYEGKQADQCPTCGHVFTPEEKADKLEAAISAYNSAKANQLKQLKDEAAEIVEERNLCRDKANALRDEITSLEHIKPTKPTFEPLPVLEEQDAYRAYAKKLNDLTKEIEQLQAAEQNTDAEQKRIAKTNALTAERKRTTEEIALLTAQLSKREEIVRLTERKQRLETNLADFNEKVVELEGTQFLIEQFTFKRSEMMQDKVNGLFSTLEWKLFDKQVNGAIVETCTCTINGVPYADANNAARINAGLEIVKVISEHIGVQAPIFIDNAESVNKLYQTGAQTIALYVTEDKQIKIQTNKNN